MEQWQDAAFVREWAAQNPPDAPERKQSHDLLLKIISNYLASTSVPARILDVGCGHGIVAARVLGEIPDAVVVGVDGSATMLELARERLAPYAGRFTLARAEFEAMTPDDLPGGPFGVVIAAQSLHNTTDEAKRQALASIRAVMAPGGLFLLLDRIRLATPGLFSAYQGVWETLGSTSFGQDHREGRTAEEHARLVSERGDKPGSLEQNLLWLREAGFREVTALHVVGLRALIAGVAG